MTGSFRDTGRTSAATAALRRAGLRATRQRVALAGLLLEWGDRHFVAEDLHEGARRAGADVSLATVYNTLRLFTEAGLLREVALGAGRSCYDTNTAEHHHFLHEDTGLLEDVPADEVGFSRLPRVPPGTGLRRVEVVVRVGPLPAPPGAGS